MGIGTVGSIERNPSSQAARHRFERSDLAAGIAAVDTVVHAGISLIGI